MSTASKPIFLDTSIEILRRFRGNDMRREIEATLDSYGPLQNSSVVRQEYKRRVLKEAFYLLKTLEKLGSFERLQRHVLHVLTGRHQRKQAICLAVLQTFFEARTDEEYAERLRRYLRSLLISGLDDLEDQVDEVREGSRCAASSAPIREVKPYKSYKFPPDRCSGQKDCPIASFLADHSEGLQKILNQLESLDEEERGRLKHWEKFCRDALADPSKIHDAEPCLKVGDILIALESIPTETFYTVNYRDSEHLCAALRQRLLYRPNDWRHPDELRGPDADS